MNRKRLLSFVFLGSFILFQVDICNASMLKHLVNFQNVKYKCYADYNQVAEIQGDFRRIIKVDLAPIIKVICKETAQPVYEFTFIEKQHFFFNIIKILEVSSSGYQFSFIKGIIYPFHFFR